MDILVKKMKTVMVSPKVFSPTPAVAFFCFILTICLRISSDTSADTSVYRCTSKNLNDQNLAVDFSTHLALNDRWLGD